MRFWENLLLGVLLAGPIWAGGEAADWPMPAVGGSLSGTLRLGPPIPEIKWKFAALANHENRIDAVVTAHADGLELGSNLSLDPRTREGHWQLLRGSVDLRSWAPVALAKSGNEKADLVASGLIQVEGGGDLHAGWPEGEVSFALNDGTVASAGLGLEISKLSLKARVSTHLVCHVDRFSMGVLGGTVEVSAVTLDLKDETFVAELVCRELDVGRFVRFLDPEQQLFVAGEGRMSGRLKISWGSSAQSRWADGRLTLDQESPAKLLFKPAPGMLTSILHSPELLKACPGIIELEMGRTPLKATLLNAHVHPMDQFGRSIELHVGGSPSDPFLQPPLEFEINVIGPLQEIAALLFQARFERAGLRFIVN